MSKALVKSTNSIPTKSFLSTASLHYLKNASVSDVEVLTSLAHHELRKSCPSTLTSPLERRSSYYKNMHANTKSIHCCSKHITYFLNESSHYPWTWSRSESLVSVAVDENPGKDPTGNVLLCYLRVATNNSHFIHTVFSIYTVLMYTSIIAAFPYQALAFVSLEQRSGKALVSSS